MEGKLITKTGRIFPVNLYNKLEAKLKEDKKEEPVQAEPAKEPDMNLIKCPKCGKMVERDRVVKKKYICYESVSYTHLDVYKRQTFGF